MCYLIDIHMIYEAAKRNFAYTLLMTRIHSGIEMEKIVQFIKNIFQFFSSLAHFGMLRS